MAVVVKSGVNRAEVDAEGKTVYQLYEDARSLCNLADSDEINVVINNQSSRAFEECEDTVLNDRDVVEFIKASGSKGF